MQGDLERDVHCLLGLPFDVTDMAGAVRRVRGAIGRRARCFISTPNVNWLVACRKDPRFRDSVLVSDLSIADGMPLVWIARFLGIPLAQRVAGAALFEQLKTDMSRPLSVYFFGGPEGVAEAAARRLNDESTGLLCVGYEYPGMGSVEELSQAQSIARINASGADLLVVSLGAKKGQAWIQRNRSRIAVPAISHLGAVVNFEAGTVRRAPAWMQGAGLEWLWRIKEEPFLLRRYAADGAEFLRLIFTRIVPLAWAMRWPPLQKEWDSASVDIVERGGDAVVRLRGAWGQRNIAKLRPRFSELAGRTRDLTIDLAAVSYVDSSFLGLLMLLYGIQKEQMRRLICTSPNPKVRRLFTYACCEFLLRGSGGRTGSAEVPDVLLEDAEEVLHG